MSLTTATGTSNDFSAVIRPEYGYNGPKDEMTVIDRANHFCWASVFRFAALGLLVVCGRLPGAEPGKSTARVRGGKQPATVSAVWQGQPLRQAMDNLARSQGVAVVIDRRLDPSTPLTGQHADATVDELFSAAAQAAGGGATRLGEVHYLGPPNTAARLRTIAALRSEEAKRLPAPYRNRLLKKMPLAWDELGEPREILRRLCAEAQVQCETSEAVPHDLWAAVKTSPLTWTDRLTLVLAQFDLTFELHDDGTAMRLAPLPEFAVIERRYPGGTSAARVAERFRQRLPEGDVSVVNGEVVVRARVEEHELLTSRSSAAQETKPVAGESRYQLQLQGVPLRQALAALEKRLMISFTYDEEGLTRAGVDLDMPVSIRVQDVTLDALLTALLQPARLAYRQEESGEYVIFPAPSSP